MRQNVTYHDDFDAKSMISVPLEREFREETISYYQVASYLFRHGLYRALTATEFALCMKEGLGTNGVKHRYRKIPSDSGLNSS